jgi:hypothetical protein
MGGVAAFWGAKMLGARLGKYSKDGTPNAIPGHHIPMAFLGTFVLLVGWMGFNGASTFAGTDFRLTVVIVNTPDGAKPVIDSFVKVGMKAQWKGLRDKATNTVLTSKLEIN